MRHLLCTAALMLTIVATASAHAVGISKGEYRVDGAKVDATLVFARQELLDAVTGLDPNRDGALSESELWHARAGIEATIVQGLEIRAAASPCVRALGDLALTEQDGVAVHIGFQCMGHARSITIAVDFIAALSHGHRHLATIGTAATVLYRGHSTFAAAIDAASHARHGVGPLFWLGIEHILTGYDHLVFLLGLMLVGGRLRSLLVVITAFTLAHSITLGAAAFRLWTPSAAIIEPAIALSIAYVGIENWFVTDAARRWMITFPFGLVHGFGFAGALEDVGLSADQIPMALAAFNAGVEVGQLAVVGVALPAILWVRSRHRLGLAVVRVASVAITVAGVWWFTVRVI